MRLAAAAAAAAVLLLPARATALPPAQGVLVPGRSLGGIQLGATKQQVREAWGTRFGRCRGCARETWYFTLRPFQPQGAGVEYRAGRVAAVFTLWSPPGWRTTAGLSLGEPAARLTQLYGALPRVRCGVYDALTLSRGATVTSFYVLDDRVWGFGLSRPAVPVCRA